MLTWIDTLTRVLFTSDVIADIEHHREVSCSNLKVRLLELNAIKLAEVESHLAAAINNFIANARWRFVDEHGERIAKVLVTEEPLMWK